MDVITLTEATFEKEVLLSELPVLVDFYADWCAPCKQLSPIVEQVAKELSGKLKVVKVDTEKSPILARNFRIQSIPALALIYQGQLVNQHVGLLDKKALTEFVRPVLPRSEGEVKPKELAQLISTRRAVPIDVRDKAAFTRYRIPGALNIPASEIQTRVGELRPSDGRVRVLYGRSTDETRDLVESLQKQGVHVGFLDGGFINWESEGLDVERGQVN